MAACTKTTTLTGEIAHDTSSGFPSMLLHSCCAPCASAAIERLIDSYSLTLFFFNPNIQPGSEHGKREAEFKKLASLAFDGKAVRIVIAEYDNEAFERIILQFADTSMPEGGNRCTACFQMRLDRTAEHAKKNGYSYFATTLTVSPHKNAEVINALGEVASVKHGVKYYASDFKKKNGFKRSVELSNELGLYRQNYCGCLCSIRD